MPHKTTWTANGIIWEYSGIVTLEQVADANTEFYNDPRSDNSKYQIFDVSAVDEIVGDEAQAKRLAAIDHGASRSIPDLKIALVINESMLPLAETYMENLSKLGCRWDCKTFYFQAEARAWITEQTR